MKPKLLFIALIFVPASGIAASADELLRGCAQIKSATERLACYDAAASSLPATPTTPIITMGEDRRLVPVQPYTFTVKEKDEEKAPTTSAPPAGDAQGDDKTAVRNAASDNRNEGPHFDLEVSREVEKSKPDSYSSWLARSWDLDREDPDDVFSLRPYRANYLLPLSWTHRPNDRPGTPRHPPTSLYDGDINKLEARFQLSLKSKIWNNLFDTPLDLWLGYTQKSFWQMYNSEWSSPFRETDYEPEVILTAPLRADILGVPLRMVGVGFVHQSNGRSDPFSRSWNRVYGMVGIERGHWSILARGWYRIPESDSKDDNPDLNDYMGYGDLIGHYEWKEYSIETMFRLNPHSGKGAARVDLTFPISGFLRGYLQFFEGYGENLLDYNYRNRSIGVGFYLSDWRLR